MKRARKGLITTGGKYNKLLKNIKLVIDTGKSNALFAMNKEMLSTYWQIGRYIIEFEQAGNIKAEYGTALLDKLSKDLKLKYGKGFSKSNIYLMRLFYIRYPIFQTSGKLGKFQTSGKFKNSTPTYKSLHSKKQVSCKLTWSHYSELLGIIEDIERNFYEKQCIKENWSVRELKRNIDSALFQRLALSKNKKEVLALAAKGHHINSVNDLVKDPYILEFLELNKSGRLTERSLEKKLIDNLQNFLLELGKGFSFVARQFRITIDGAHFYIDLVFYHRILKCFILIDLKIKKVNHRDIGQMNLYLNYFKEEENSNSDNPPIGIIIAPGKHEFLVKYATGGLSNKIFVSKYQLHLPDKKILEQKVREIMEDSKVLKKRSPGLAKKQHNKRTGD